MADADSLRRLWRYKSDLEESPDEEKLIEILGKLKQIPVTVSSLQETGMGKLINRFGKQKGVVGDNAAAVVAIWKTTVEKEVEKRRLPKSIPPLEGLSSDENDSNAESDATSWDSYDKGYMKREDLADDKGVGKQSKEQKYRHAKITGTASNAFQEMRAKHKNVSSKAKRYKSFEMEESHSYKTAKKSMHTDRESRHQPSLEDNKSRHHSSSTDKSKAKNSHSGNSKSMMMKELGSNNNTSTKYESTSKIHMKISDEEELTDSDETFAEESTNASNIEEYFKKMLEESTSAPVEKSRERSGNKEKDSFDEDREKGFLRHQKENPWSLPEEMSSGMTGVNSASSRSNYCSSVKDKGCRKESSLDRQKNHSALSSSSSQHQSKGPSSPSNEKIKVSSSNLNKFKPSSQSGEGKRSTSQSSASVKREKEHKKVERKRKQHSMSDSEKETENLPEKQSKTDSWDGNKHNGSKHSKSKHQLSKSYSQHHLTHSLNVKKEKIGEDSRYSSRCFSALKGQHSQLNLQIGHERLSEVEEDLYSPKRVGVKEEKIWNLGPSSNRAHYSPTPISNIEYNKQGGSDVDSLSERSYSPSIVSAHPLHLQIEVDGALRYSPWKTFTSLKKESSSSVSSRETTPNYNPTPIKKECSVSPCPLPRRSKPNSQVYESKKSSRSHALDKERGFSPTFDTQVKLEPSDSQSDTSCEGDPLVHYSRPATKIRGRAFRMSPISHSQEASPNSDSSQSQGSLKRRGHLLSAADSPHSEGEDSCCSSPLPQQKCKKDPVSSNPFHLSDDASRGYIPTLTTAEIDEDKLSDSDVSDGAHHYESFPLPKYHSEPVTFHSPKLSKQREIKSERLCLALSSHHEEDDIYLPQALSNKIREEPYSPTPKSSSTKNTYLEELPLKSLMTSSLHTEKHKPSNADKRKSSTSRHQSSKTLHNYKSTSSAKSIISVSTSVKKDKNFQRTPSDGKLKPESSTNSYNKLSLPSNKSTERYISKSTSSSTHKLYSKSSSQHHAKIGANKSTNNSIRSIKNDAYSSSGPKTSSSLPSSGSKKMKAKKRKAEEPELDLFSDAFNLKITALSSVPKNRSANTLLTKSSRELESVSPRSSPPVSVQTRSFSEHYSKDKRSDKIFRKGNEKTHIANNLFHNDSDEEVRDGNIPAPSPMKYLMHLDEKEEAQMSFEDFMNCDSAAVLNKSKSSVKPSTGSKKASSQIHKSHKSHSLSSQKASTCKSRTSYFRADEDFYIPAPSKNVKVTELDILSSLPETQALYHPLLPKKIGLSWEDEADQGTSQANLEDIGLKKLARTQVYCGRRQGVTEVKPLFDLCMQLLIENIDALDCVGGVPYDVLKPVLERCTAQQLYHLEDYNPHFLEDTDELWEKLCQRDFRGSKPDEMELWREMYLRKHNEREIKYQKLKESMSSTILKGQSGRKAQLAYMDTPVKAPRDVLRRQIKFGTGCVKMNKGQGAGVKSYRPIAANPVYNPMADRSRVAKPMPPMMAQAIRMRKNMRR